MPPRLLVATVGVVIIGAVGCTAHPAKAKSSSSPTAGRVLPRSQLTDATLTLADMPSGWVSHPKLAPTRHQASTLCSAASRPVRGGFRSVAFSAPGYGDPLVMEELDLLSASRSVTTTLDTIELDVSSCSRFRQHGVRYRIEKVLLPLKSQRYLALDLRFREHRTRVTEYVVFIQQDNVLVEVEEATPTRVDTSLLLTTAEKAIHRVAYAESHAAPLPA